jgi:hypothetical protein
VTVVPAAELEAPAQPVGDGGTVRVTVVGVPTAKD